MRGDTDASCYPRSRTPTKSSEDYLEAILVIRRLRGSYRNVNIAERLGRSKPSVTKALSNLAATGLVRMSATTSASPRRASVSRRQRSSATASSSGCSSRPPRRRPDTWSTACQRTPADVSRLISEADETRAMAGKRRAAFRPDCATGSVSTDHVSICGNEKAPRFFRGAL